MYEVCWWRMWRYSHWYSIQEHHTPSLVSEYQQRKSIFQSSADLLSLRVIRYSQKSRCSLKICWLIGSCWWRFDTNLIYTSRNHLKVNISISGPWKVGHTVENTLHRKGTAPPFIIKQFKGLKCKRNRNNHKQKEENFMKRKAALFQEFKKEPRMKAA